MRFIAYLISLLQGWRYNIELDPKLRSFVLVAAPHTSNWDFIPAMGLLYKMKRDPRFIIKKSWLKFPMNLILGPLGAYGIDREKIKSAQGNHTTDVLADIFKENSEFIMMISPEGTRSPNENWKTGFYYVAKKANVPIVLVYADYVTKDLVMNKVIYPNDYEEDMKVITQYFAPIRGKIPENFKLDRRFI